MAVVQLFRREARNREAFAAINRRAPGRQHAGDLLLRGLLPGDRAAGGAGHRADPDLRRRPGARGRRSRSARSWPSSSTRSASGGRSPTSPRSSTCCRRRWRPPSASSACSTPRRSSATPAGRGAPAGGRGPRPLRERVVRVRVDARPARRRSASDWVARGHRLRGRAGRSVALVGATGAGKTSIISLLMRFYDAQRGRVALDGVDVREWDLQAAALVARRSCCRTCTCSAARSPRTSASARDDPDRARARRGRGGARPPLHRGAAPRATTPR